MDFLVSPKEKLVDYVGNEVMLKISKRQMLKKKFPIYGCYMRRNFDRAIHSRASLDRAKNNLAYLWPIFDPTHLVMEDVLKTLSEED